MADPRQGRSSCAVQGIKCVVIGDDDADKTTMLVTYTEGQYPREYFPTVFDNYSENHVINGRPYSLGLRDTSGQADYDRFRVLSYPQTDVFLVCFSVTSPWSFKSVREKWVPEIIHHCSRTPFLIVGTKIDLRNDPFVLEKLAKNNQKPVTVKQGKKLARELGAAKYVECSALTGEGLKNVFDQAILTAIEPLERDHKKICSIL